MTMNSKGQCRWVLLAVLTAMLLANFSSPAYAQAVGDDLRTLAPLEQRARLLERFRRDGDQAVPLLEEALGAEALFVRRTAAHLLARIGAPAREQLEAALGNEDFEVRAIAIRGLADLGLLPYYTGVILQDEHRTIRRIVQLLLEDSPLPEGEAQDAFVSQLARVYHAEASEGLRRNAVQYLVALPSPGQVGQEALRRATRDGLEEIRKSAFARLFELVALDTEQGQALLGAAEADDSMEIREMAFQAAQEKPSDPFPEGADLQLAQEDFLPSDGWMFCIDAERHGHANGWFRTDFDDSDWRDIGIGKAWHEFVGERHIGVAWYRRSFEAPDFPEGAVALLHFAAVDECAWVWVNGEYAGQHNIGPSGWDVPFHLDASGLIQPGEENFIAVRVMNTAGAGGIWMPVSLRIFEAAAPR